MDETLTQPHVCPLRPVIVMSSNVRFVHGRAAMQIGPPGEPADALKLRQVMSRMSVHVVALQPPLDW